MRQISRGIILIIKAKEMHHFSPLFGKELYMFRTDLLSIIRSLNTVFTAIGICHTGRPKYSKGNLSQCSVVQHKLHMNYSGVEPDSLV